MATPQELLALLGARQIPNTSLITQGGKSPVRPQSASRPAQPAPVRRRSVPTGLSGQIFEALGQQNRPAPQVEAPGGLKGLAAKALGNKVTQAVLKPLEVLQYPGAAVTGSVRQLLDTAAAEWANKQVAKLPGVDYSPIKNPDYEDGFQFSELWDDIKDKKGFGTSIVEPAMGESGTDRNIWIRRLAGFSGDVAADPLTYLSGGATQAAGKVGRRALAAKAFNAGFNEEQIARAAKGAAFLDDAERKALKIEQAGLRFGGKEGVLIPGTKHLSNAVFRTTGTAREAITTSRPWQVITNQPEKIEEAAKVLAGVPGSSLSKTQAAAIVAYHDVVKMANKDFVEPAQHEAAQRIFSKVTDQSAAGLTHAVETGQANELTPFMRQLRKMAEDAGVKVGDLGERYMPRLRTKEFQALVDGKTMLGQKLAKITVDDAKATGVVLQRKLRGIVDIDGHKINFDAPIADINRQLTAAFPEAGITKWFEDDARDLVSYYINSLGRNIGAVKGFKHLLDRGIAANLEDVADDVIKEFVDTTANDAARKAGKELLDKRQQAFKEAQAQAVKDATELQKVLSQKLHAMLDEANEVDAQFADIVKGLTEGRQSLVDVKAAFGQRAQALKADAQAKLDELERQWFDLEGEIEAAQLKLAAAEDRSLPAQVARMQKLQERRSALYSQMQQHIQATQEFDELTADIAQAVAASETLAAQASDPDFVAQFAQSLVPTRTVEFKDQRFIDGVPEQELVDPEGALAQAEAAKKRTDALYDSVKQDTMAELKTVREVESRTAEQLDQAKQFEDEARAQLDFATEEMVKARRARGGDTVARPNTVKGLRATKGTAPKLLPAERELAEAAGVIDDLKRIRAAAEQRAEHEATTLRIASQARDTIQEGVDIADAKAAKFNERAADIQANPMDFRPGTPAEVVAQGQGQLDKAVDKALDKAVNHMRTAWLGRQELEKAEAELAKAVARASSEHSTVAVANEAIHARMADLGRKIQAADEASAEILATLPKEEQLYWTQLQNFLTARSTRQALERRLEKVSAAARRVERRGTPEAEIAARHSLQPMLEASAAANTYYRPVFTYGSEEVPTMQLAPRAELEAGLEAATDAQGGLVKELNKDIKKLNERVKDERKRLYVEGRLSRDNEKVARQRFEDALTEAAGDVYRNQSQYKIANKELQDVTGGAEAGVDAALRRRPGADQVDDVAEIGDDLGVSVDLQDMPPEAARVVATNVQSTLKRGRRDSITEMRAMLSKFTGIDPGDKKAAELVDAIRLKAPKKKAADPSLEAAARKARAAKAKKMLDEVWEQVPVARRQQLLDEGESLADKRSALAAAKVEKRNIVQGGPQAEIEKQLGFYDEAEDRIASLQSDLAEEIDVKRAGAEQALDTAVNTADATAQLDELPTLGQQQADEISAARAELQPLQDAQDHITPATVALDKALRRIDEVTADEYARIDQAVLARDNSIAVMEGRQAMAADEAKRIEGQLKKVEKLNVGGKAKVVSDELNDIVKQLPDNPELEPVFALHAAYLDSLAKMADKQGDVIEIKKFIDEAKSGKLNTIAKMEAMKGWTEVIPGLLADAEGGVQRIAVPDEVAAGMRRLIEGIDNGDAWKAIDALTQFFKTYATATPGFHLRNAMSAVFMNTTEGVTLKQHRQAMKLWRGFMEADKPMAYIDGLDDAEREAFKATFGSGAGGGYSSEELGHWSNKVMHNAWTKWNRKLGANVEGPARLALALNTTQAKGSAADALARITRIHFDYSEVGRLDRAAKHFIPFWTFMSRNLPLQMQQIWMRPKMYSIYGHLADTLGSGNEFEGMPQWLADQSAIPLGPNGDGGQNVISPDLPFLNAKADMETFDVRNLPRVLSNLNPVMVAPLEAISNKDLYYDSELRGNPIDHIAKSVLPPYAQLQRLTGQGKYKGQEQQRWANYFGIPFHEVSQQQIAREMQRRAREG